MKHIPLVIALVATLAPAGAQARPPQTQSLADCAIIANLGNRHAPHRSQTQVGKLLDSFSYRFAEKAMREARAVGFSVDEMEALLKRREAYWMSKGVSVAAEPEFRYALEMCRYLADDRGIAVAALNGSGG